MDDQVRIRFEKQFAPGNENVPGRDSVCMNIKVGTMADVDRVIFRRELAREELFMKWFEVERI